MQYRTAVIIHQMATPDGPPPYDVQVAVADWDVDYITWQNQH